MSGGRLTVRGLTVTDHDVVVVEGLAAEVGPGQKVAVVGSAASGAAALLEVLSGTRAPDAGSVELGRVAGPIGHRATRSEPHELARAVGYVPQGHQLLGALTAVENVALVLVAAGSPAERAWRRAEAMLAGLGLPPGAWHNLAEELSGGQQQRVSVARALIDQPRVIIADDPTSDLDAASAALVLGQLDLAVRAGSCLVIATNDPAVVEACDLVWQL